MDPWKMMELMALVGPALQNMGPTGAYRTEAEAKAAANPFRSIGAMLGQQAQGLMAVNDTRARLEDLKEQTEQRKLVTDRLKAERNLREEIMRSFGNGGGTGLGGTPLGKITEGIPGMGGESRGVGGQNQTFAGLGGPSIQQMAKYMTFNDPKAALSLMYPNEVFTQNVNGGTMYGVKGPGGVMDVGYSPPNRPSPLDMLLAGDSQGVEVTSTPTKPEESEDDKYKVSKGKIAAEAAKFIGGKIADVAGAVLRGPGDSDAWWNKPIGELATSLREKAMRRREAFDAVKNAVKSGDRELIGTVYQLYNESLDYGTKKYLLDLINKLDKAKN